eukprot:TRINITY_DN2806_c0_g1_i17.p1 TRINITY_DN2806_c0_g1~~TRINITY_DN2806_c0_g1_i17.p1  ORF type:complete len:247 (+),score=40.83 TRINITY_DN2806_c0_g1_i17:1393-2133(+)
MIGSVILSVASFFMASTSFHPLISMTGLGISIGIFEPTLYTALAAVTPADSVDVAFSFNALMFQIVMFAFPFVVGVIHDKYESYDFAGHILGASGLLSIILGYLLYHLDPELQSRGQQVQHATHYRPVVVSQRRILARSLKRRHSITEGEVSIIHKIMEEHGLLDSIDFETELDEPVLIDPIHKYNTEEEHGIDFVEMHSASLPPNYWSEIVDVQLKLVPCPVSLDSNWLDKEGLEVVGELVNDGE